MERISFIIALKRIQAALNIFDKINDDKDYNLAVLYSLSRQKFMLPNQKEGSLVEFALSMNDYLSALHLITSGHSYDSEDVIEEALAESLSNIDDDDISKLTDDNEIKRTKKERYLKNREALTKLKELYPSRVRA